jgi:hypothetical protein
MKVGTLLHSRVLYHGECAVSTLEYYMKVSKDAFVVRGEYARDHVQGCTT